MGQCRKCKCTGGRIYRGADSAELELAGEGGQQMRGGCGRSRWWILAGCEKVDAPMTHFAVEESHSGLGGQRVGGWVAASRSRSWGYSLLLLNNTAVFMSIIVFLGMLHEEVCL